MLLTVTLNAAIDKRYVVENYRVGEVNRVKTCTYTPGGKGLNVSKPAAIAGARVTATGFVGGHAGHYIEESLKPFGIESAFYHLPEESRSCVNVWDERNHTQTEFLEPGFTVGETDFAGFLGKFENLLPGADVVAVSGSVPKGLDGSAYRRLVDVCKNAGKKVILDTSGSLLATGIQSCPTMVKPNLDEIRMLTGRDCTDIREMLEAARQLHRGGISYVAISLGGDGSLLVCDEGSFRAKVPPIDAVNTVGCGDSMIAGFALGLAKGLTAPDMLRQASAISAAAALREETGYFLPADRDRLLPQIKIEKI